MGRAIQPGSGVKGGDHRAEYIDIGMGQTMGREVHRSMETTAVEPHVGKCLGMPRGGGTQASW